MSDALDRLAAAHGVALDYISEEGARCRVSDAAKRGVLAALGVAAGTEREIELSLAGVAHQAPDEGWKGAGVKCFMPDWLAEGRAWGITCQLYGLRSARNWGIGDFEDLARLSECAAASGADFIGVSPLHALFLSEPTRCSPYSPSSRLWLNPLYIAVDRLGMPAPRPGSLEAARAADLVDYVATAGLKIPALRALFDAFERRDIAQHTSAGRQFADFCRERGDALDQFAVYEALSGAMVARDGSCGWHSWPEAYRSPRCEAVRVFARENASSVKFHTWMQWVADSQLGEAQRRARAAGMRIGLYLDLAVGVAPDGADTWAAPDTVLPGVRIGSPPDPFNARGQDWGLAPLSPRTLREHKGASFVAVVGDLMRHAGAIRIDHAMGLTRLYLIPAGSAATDGAYVAYPARDLVSGLAAASQQNHAIVVGEDLGTVPTGFRDAMRASEIQGYRVLYFERGDDGSFRPPDTYPREAVSCVSTHDLPTLRGWWIGSDIAERAQLGLYDAQATTRDRNQRAQDRCALLEALARANLLPPGFATDRAKNLAAALPNSLSVAAHTFLARTASRLVAVQLEDMFGVVPQANLPGTVHGHPNWRRKLPIELERIGEAVHFEDIAGVMRQERPRNVCAEIPAVVRRTRETEVKAQVALATARHISRTSGRAARDHHTAGVTSINMDDFVETHRPLDVTVLAHLTQDAGILPEEATLQHWLHAVTLTVRDQLVLRWHETNRRVRRQGLKQVAYLSMEFLMGRDLANALHSLGLEDEVRTILATHRVSLDAVCDQQVDPALGNGGLGRLAACFLDSMATVGVPGTGYGIRYEFGMFRQRLADGWQVEEPDEWLGEVEPAEFPRPERTYRVCFGGRVEHRDHRAHWVDCTPVLAVAFDRLVPGHDSDTVNTLRLWAPRAAEPIDLAAFNRGAFQDALARKVDAETIGRVLYPDDTTAQGRELRLRQQYFFVSASVQDVLARFRADYTDWDRLPEQVAIHLNDTHPALAPVELMHRLVDEYAVDWDRAWRLTQQVCAYTNHTLMPEALEVWPVELMQRLLPRHLELLAEIERRFLADIPAPVHDDDVRARVRLIEGSGQAQVNMGRLSALACHRVNGVSELHSRLVKETLFPDFARLYPDRFTNVTNGITQRRWLELCNPELSALLDATIGTGWRQDFEEIGNFARFAGDSAIGQRLHQIKRGHKERLAGLIEQRTGIRVDPAAMADVQVKRIHEYKRQLLNILGFIARWNAVKAAPQTDLAPRVVVLAGKAASAYWLAKRIIKLAYDVGERINRDPETADRLKIVFLPNYNVSLAEIIMPAADLSQQISLAGTEASGTGNMKLALNGALTLGTADGANIEIAEAVGSENIFTFGLDVAGVRSLRAVGYAPGERYAQDPRIRQALDQIGSGFFSPDEPDRHRAIVESPQQGDRYLVLADFPAYMTAQEEVDRVWSDKSQWVTRAARNIAGMGRFSSDRAIREYADRIWQTGHSGPPSAS